MTPAPTKVSDLNQLDWHGLCCRVIDAAAGKPAGQAIHYAASYARAGKDIHSPEGRKAQAFYILSNLNGWRGPEARTVKALLQEYAR